MGILGGHTSTQRVGLWLSGKSDLSLTALASDLANQRGIWLAAVGGELRLL
ncbi:MAG: hypothetical protein J07HR59_00121 [Halorubrum sp. J07HR59]|nr:MAG: hypothetical protein J07HR59_00121 [Halorubrum sp. J07HR59]